MNVDGGCSFCVSVLRVFFPSTHRQVYVMLEYQISNVYQDKQDLLLLFPDVFTLWNSLALLIALPIVNFLVLPCVPSWTMRERMGFGVALIGLSAVITAYLEWCVFPLVSPHRQFLWLVLPIATISLGEMMLFVTGERGVVMD